jgi:hypothetical protein
MANVSPFFTERDVLKCLYICVFISVADILNEMDPFMIDLFGFYFLFLVQFSGIHSDVFVKLSSWTMDDTQPNEATGQAY